MSSPSVILGIESSCDETAAAIVSDGVVRSNVVASQVALHEEYGGVVPEIASRAHLERIVPIIREAISEAGVSMPDISAIAVGHRPGLIGALLVGVSAAKALAWTLGVPIIGVDHVHAHLFAPCMTLDPDDVYPAIAFVASGGHTSIYRCDSPTNLQRLGSTRDDAVGEAYDKVAAILGLGYPGGPEVDRQAQLGDDRAIDFPISRLGKDSLDFSFSGLKTAVLYAARGTPNAKGELTAAPELTPDRIRDICASFQRAAIKALILKLGRAVEASHGIKAIIIGGGVAANSRLRAEIASFADEHRLAVLIPEMDLCVDNAAMIAGLGERMINEGTTHGLDLTPVPTTSC